MIGRELEVLVEGASKSNSDKLFGRSRQNHIIVFNGPHDLTGKLVDITIREVTDLTLFGTLKY